MIQFSNGPKTWTGSTGAGSRLFRRSDISGADQPTVLSGMLSPIAPLAALALRGIWHPRHQDTQLGLSWPALQELSFKSARETYRRAHNCPRHQKLKRE